MQGWTLKKSPLLKFGYGEQGGPQLLFDASVILPQEHV
jgi:hypothetical protein